MNIFALFSVLFATTTVILWYVVLAYREEIAQLRTMNNELIDSGQDVLTYCDALELRNDYLESRCQHASDLVAAAVAFSPVYRELQGEYLTIQEGDLP